MTESTAGVSTPMVPIADALRAIQRNVQLRRPYRLSHFSARDDTCKKYPEKCRVSVIYCASVARTRLCGAEEVGPYWHNGHIRADAAADAAANCIAACRRKLEIKRRIE